MNELLKYSLIFWCGAMFGMIAACVVSARRILNLSAELDHVKHAACYWYEEYHKIERVK